MDVNIPKAIRKLVIERAGHRCEYCRVPAFLTGFEYHLEHVIALQHGGSSAASNLAYSCPPCNWKKGPNIATFGEDGRTLVPLFNPRTQNWFEHFTVVEGAILGLTPVGKATVRLLDLNAPDKVIERLSMMRGSFYP